MHKNGNEVYNRNVNIKYKRYRIKHNKIKSSGDNKYSIFMAKF